MPRPTVTTITLTMPDGSRRYAHRVDPTPPRGPTPAQLAEVERHREHRSKVRAVALAEATAAREAHARADLHSRMVADLRRRVARL